MTWIQTHLGMKFDLLAPSAAQVNIGDISHALSLICRFGGHCRHHYSVAQHSVLVSDATPRQFALQALLHDAAEAYIGDMVKPLKELLPEFSAIEELVLAQIYRAFRVQPTPESEASILEIDLKMLATEARDLIGTPVENWTARLPHPYPDRITPWSPAVAREQFMRRFESLRWRAPATHYPKDCISRGAST